ncbi:hydroxymethylglutaryl-CoA reductase [Sinorhizobium medicae]|uniref:hydroxymethylglutaryl-CoA reductase n=1 Tax=Sinorhizobium medicae TaxID=110321 RepID=UPI000FD8D50F|nr:hydroxymethylglutaryl-CoA reductase [Sinorhizobium medicae]MBO1965395.1 hydroxymethylglutaryl-CoA reductase [Sinorhizobium medicae]RVJ68957.1 hydroxymethylglutaryl-CoA reductase [Sinorhizobium medicae]WQO56990.1 hydroxymethylglutaryl-CoA reductase [Sinorhizobium medicae]WQP40996.1 hydroxymethylglutaryl-CoA reductase [Sinorhizobium medicae]
MKIPRDPQNDFSPQQVAYRQDWLSKMHGRDYPYLFGSVPTEPDQLLGTIENYLGLVGVPVGIAGPLLVHGKYAKGDYFVPLATTEGALVASFSRGMQLLTEAGGVTTFLPDNQWSPDEADSPYRFRGDALTKISAICLRSPADAASFDSWLRAHAVRLSETANATSRFARLKEVTPIFQGDIVGLAFRYETDNAMGLNMATKGNEAACHYIMEHAGDLVTGYFNTLGGDKRFVPDEAKGRYVTASATISAALIERRVRSTPDKMRRFLLACNLVLSQRGATAPNIHIANALAALFIACGQDPAFTTVAFRNASTCFEVNSAGDLVASVTLPNVLVGTVGGGTKLPTQRECLAMLDSLDDARKLAEIAAAVALAGEVSVAGAVSAGEFTRAHTELGRGRQHVRHSDVVPSVEVTS